ncbi:MAG: DUF748 domain-containing protein [Prolixibacteraceae bacterium]|nr:DUF748 domain-containing protein [Prolixibacteraceae bacterium]
MKKTYKIILVFILPAIIVLIAAVLIALPSVLKNYINKHGQEYSGRKTTVQDIKIDYFRSTLSIMDFKLYEADGNAMFVSFDSLTISIKPLPLFSSKLVVEKFRIVKPAVNIIKKDTIYNFDDILAFVNAKPKEKVSEKPSKPFAYFLNNISMEQGKLVFTDKMVNSTTNLKDLSFFIPSVNFNQDELKDAGIKFHFENGGFFQAKANYNQKHGSYQADFTIDNLDISPFLPYAKEYFKINKLGGLVGGDFRLTGNINNLDSILLRGKGHVADFSANDLVGQKVVGSKSATVKILDTYPMKYSFRFSDLELNEPYLYVEMKDSTINWLNLMMETPADTVPFNYFYQIKKLSIVNGLLDLRDNSYEAPFDYHLSEIAMKVDSISSTSKWLNAFATMRLNQRGKLQAELGINPSDPYEMKVNYVITNFQLSDLSIFSRHYVGYPILLGNMYYQGKTSITGKQLTSENKLIVRNAKLGKKSKGLMNLPLRLALYLLKDIHGDIILDLPLSGDLNDPKTNISKLVWTTLKNVVIKVVASPFIALGGLLGVEPGEVKGIEFNYADTILTATHMRRIKLFTELEKKKPDMQVAMNYFNDAALEKKEIATREAGKLFQAETGADYQKESEKFTAFLRMKLHSDTVNTVDGSALLIGGHKLDSIQHNISQKRIKKIEAALLGFDESTRIKVTVPDSKTPENLGSRPVFELKFSVDE